MIWVRAERRERELREERERERERERVADRHPTGGWYSHAATQSASGERVSE